MNNRMTLTEFKEGVKKWAMACGIYENLTVQSQEDLYFKETEEYRAAETFSEKQDEMGDRLVCLINCIHMKPQDLTVDTSIARTVEGMIGSGWHSVAFDGVLAEALQEGFVLSEMFYNTLKKLNDRKGMIVGNKWTKYEDLNDDQKMQVDIELDS